MQAVLLFRFNTATIIIITCSTDPSVWSSKVEDNGRQPSVQNVVDMYEVL